MKKLLYMLFIFPSFLFSQAQIGQNIYGDNAGDRFGWCLSIANSDGTLAIGAPLGSYFDFF